MDNDKLNLYQKIARIKGEMAKAKLPKTGRNNFTKFNYFQLDDFEPFLERLCSEYGVITYFQFTTDLASMIIANADVPDQVLEISSPVAISAKTGYTMQDIGAMQTYARRYLFMSFFGITESDTLDEILGRDEPPRQNTKSMAEPKPQSNTQKEDNRPCNQTQSNNDADFMSVWRKAMAKFGYDSKKAKESESNKKALSEAKGLISQRYGKDSITLLSKEQIDDLDAFLSNAPENFVSDDIPA